MPSSAFIVLAVLMVIAALIALIVPLMRRGDPSPLAAGALVAVLPLSVALLYLSYSNWPWDNAAPEPGLAAHAGQQASLDEMVVRLEQRLESSPDDAEGWQMLGRTYVVLSRYADAVEAYRQARELTGDQDVNALTGYAEALGMVRGGIMDAEVSALFEQALALSPDDRKGLWYGGLAAFEQGRPGLARSRWQRLLELGAPEEMAEILRQQIAAADAELGETPAPQIPAATSVEAIPGDGLVLSVALSPELAGRVRPDAPLFILARQVDAPGPPLAVVRRQAADLPFEVVLTDANSMVAGRVLSAFENVEVVARIALGGTPTAQSGDLSGSKTVASSGNASILIDSVVGN